MEIIHYQIVFLGIAFGLANLPWLTERCFLVMQCEQKPVWIRFAEWLVYLMVAGLVGWGLEKRVMGHVASQDWEFYAVTASIFAVFAAPGFIYRHIR